MTGRMEEILFYPLLLLTYGSSISCMIELVREEITEAWRCQGREMHDRPRTESLMLRVSTWCALIFLVATLLVVCVVGKVGVEGR